MIEQGRSPLLAAVLSITLLCACSSPPPPPPSVTEAPKNPYENLEKKISRIQEDSAMPALQVRVMERGEIKFNYSRGQRAAGKEAPLQPRDRFHLGPASSAVTAVLAAQLIDLKLVDWNTPLRQLLPKDTPIHLQHKDTTLEMILSQKAGFADPKDLQGKKLWPQLYSMDTRAARTKLAKAILAAAPRFKPGSKSEPSLSAFVVLGWILEEKTNFRWEELAKNKIFLHLNMNDCGFGPAANAKAPTPDQPWGHDVDKEGVPVAVIPSPKADFPAALNPASGLTCPMDDWVKFLEMISQGFYRESTFLSEGTFARLLDNVGETPFTSSGFMRFERSWAAGNALVISGGNKMNYMFATIAPSREYTIVVLTNTGSKDAEKGVAQIVQLLTELK